jgi:hypothetical protein
MIRRREIWLWILVFGALRSTAQSPQPSQEPHTLRGTVVNSVTGEPIYRALVQIGGQFATLTDHEGHFEFEGITEASSSQWAMKPGYFSELGGQRYSPSSQVSGLASDQTFIVKLVPEAVISGTVTGQDGAPVEGIPVQLKTLAASNGLQRWETRQATKTNSEGQYRFYELQAGKYAVVTGSYAGGLADERSVAYVPVRYPAAAGTEAQSAIQLAPGEHREVNLSPDVQRLYPVSGVVNGYGESRSVSFQVRTNDGEEVSASSSHFNPRTSEFRLLLPGGSYLVTATAYVQRGSLESSLQITVPQSPVSGVSFALEPGATIPVDIDVETVSRPADSTGAVQNGIVDLAGQSPSVYVTLAKTDDAGAYPASSPGRRGGAGSGSGPLVIENVPPGRYILQVQPSGGGYYVSSASCGGVDLTHEELTIANGAAGCSIRVVLRNDGGSVQVTYRDFDATGRYRIFLYPLGDLVRTSRLSSGTTGNFTFSDIPPGRYLAIAQDHQEELPYHDPEAMRRYGGLGQEITVSANSVTNVEVRPAHVDP